MIKLAVGFLLLHFLARKKSAVMVVLHFQEHGYPEMKYERTVLKWLFVGIFIGRDVQ